MDVGGTFDMLIQVVSYITDLVQLCISFSCMENNPRFIHAQMFTIELLVSCNMGVHVLVYIAGKGVCCNCLVSPSLSLTHPIHLSPTVAVACQTLYSRLPYHSCQKHYINYIYTYMCSLYVPVVDILE